jgi:hypothetical protein
MRGHDAGSTVDAMSDAIEGADVMLYGVSLKYKESANVRISHSCISCLLRSCSAGQALRLTVRVCPAHWLHQCRLEANYAHQQELDMIPLKMQKGYSPKCVSYVYPLLPDPSESRRATMH